MAAKLTQAFETLTQQLGEEQSTLSQQKEEVEKQRASLEAEKAAMMQVNISREDVLELNVGGELISSKRTTILAAPEESMLNAMFSGRWDTSISRDSQGRIFLDFTPRLFGVILSRLRTMSLSPPGTRFKSPVIPKEDDEEFQAMVKFLGLQEMLYGAKTGKTSVSMRACDGSASVEATASRTIVTHNATSEHTASVGADPLKTFPSIWKATVQQLGRQLGSNAWVGIGVISSESPTPATSYGDATSQMWAGTGQVYVNGKLSAGLDGWSGWQAGDVAIIKLDVDHGVMKMHHSRLNRMFEIRGITPGLEWRLYVNLYGAHDRVELMEATPAEGLLVA